LAWHPFNESKLAYGTDDGRVGVFPSLSKKAPIIFGTYHQKIVYVVSWGPRPFTDGKIYIISVGCWLSLYACMSHQL